MFYVRRRQGKKQKNTSVCYCPFGTAMTAAGMYEDLSPLELFVLHPLPHLHDALLDLLDTPSRRRLGRVSRTLRAFVLGRGRSRERWVRRDRAHDWNTNKTPVRVQLLKAGRDDTTPLVLHEYDSQGRFVLFLVFDDFIMHFLDFVHRQTVCLIRREKGVTATSCGWLTEDKIYIFKFAIWHQPSHLIILGKDTISVEEKVEIYCPENITLGIVWNFVRTATDFIKSFNEPTRGLELVLERTSSVFKEASKENPVYCDISGPLYAVGGVVQDAEDKSMVTVRSLADDEVVFQRELEGEVYQLRIFGSCLFAACEVRGPSGEFQARVHFLELEPKQGQRDFVRTMHSSFGAILLVSFQGFLVAMVSTSLQLCIIDFAKRVVAGDDDESGVSFELPKWLKDVETSDGRRQHIFSLEYPCKEALVLEVHEVHASYREPSAPRGHAHAVIDVRRFLESKASARAVMDKVSEDLCKVDNYKGHVNRAVCCTEDGVVIAGSDYRSGTSYCDFLLYGRDEAMCERLSALEERGVLGERRLANPGVDGKDDALKDDDVKEEQLQPALDVDEEKVEKEESVHSAKSAKVALTEKIGLRAKARRAARAVRKGVVACVNLLL